MACCVLHNMCRKAKLPDPEDADDFIIHDDDDNEWQQEYGNDIASGLRVRDALINYRYAGMTVSFFVQKKCMTRFT